MRNCFIEYHDERLFIEAEKDNLEAVEVVDFSAEDGSEAADDNIYPLVIYSSSEDSDGDYIDISGTRICLKYTLELSLSLCLFLCS